MRLAGAHCDFFAASDCAAELPAAAPLWSCCWRLRSRNDDDDDDDDDEEDEDEDEDAAAAAASLGFFA